MHKHKDKKKNENKKSNEQPSTKYYTTTTSKAQSETEDVSNSFSKRALTTNWSQYKEEANPIDDNEQLCAADFENLLVTPASVGSHFIFSTERNWENNTEATSQYFKLNILDLSRTLATLPFYVRQGYAPDIFDNAELKEMDTNARHMQQNLPKEFSTLAKPKQKSMDKAHAPPDVVVLVADPIQEIAPLTTDSEELDALLECTMKPISSLSDIALDSIENLKIVTTSPNTASKDIQQWLDDIFDD